MFVVNAESLAGTKLYYCKSLYLMRFLTEMKGLNFIARERIVDSNKFVWMFVKTDELNEALAEWKLRKEQKNFAFRGVTNN